VRNQSGNQWDLSLTGSPPRGGTGNRSERCRSGNRWGTGRGTSHGGGDLLENTDLIWLARGFAERMADGDWNAALQWAQVAENVSRGGHAVLARYDGGLVRGA
jgi:hypothetical protein